MCESDFLAWISSLVRNVWIIVANDGDFFSFLNQFNKSLLVFHEGYMFRGPQKTIEKIFEVLGAEKKSPSLSFIVKTDYSANPEFYKGIWGNSWM